MSYSKLQQNSPVPMKQPKKHYGAGDQGTETAKKGSTVVGQPELTRKNNPIKQAGLSHHDKNEDDESYTD